jgi:hypothetical protein
MVKFDKTYTGFLIYTGFIQDIIVYFKLAENINCVLEHTSDRVFRERWAFIWVV